MRLYDISVTYPEQEDRLVAGHAKVHKGIVGRSDTQAICKAQSRHMNEGRPMMGAKFKITGSKLILDPSEITEAA